MVYPETASLAKKLAATMGPGTTPADVLGLSIEVMSLLMSRIEIAERTPDLMSGSAPELARLLVDHYSLVVAEWVGAATPPEPHDSDPAVTNTKTKRMFQ